MPTQTTNYNLTKPVASDFYDITVPNGNMDKIDTQMKKMDVENATAKTTIVDADTIGFQDSTETGTVKVKKITWANIKAVLANVFAAASHTHSTTDITSGTLPVARGGTGQTSATPAVGTFGYRAIGAGTSDITAGSTALETGAIYFVYE